MRLRYVLLTLFGVGAVAATFVAGGRMRGVPMAHIVHPSTGAPLTVPGKDGDATLLFNGWKISPVGKQIPVGDMLLGGAFSPDGKLYAIANAGFKAHSINIIDVASGERIAHITVGKVWNGIAWAPDGKRIYVSGGVSGYPDDIHIAEQDAKGEWAQVEGLHLKTADSSRMCFAGMQISADGHTLYAVNVSDKRLYVIDTLSGRTLGTLEVGDHPVACRLSLNGKTLYVANWGGASIAVVDVHLPNAPTVTEQFKTGDHPNDIALSVDDRIYVSCGNSDCVTVIDLRTQRATETIRTALTPKAPEGSTPNAIVVSPDNHTLYVANADNNDVAVIDVSRRNHSHVKGFIPTGWYPTSVAVTPDGKTILIGSGKGIGSHPNPSSRKTFVEPPGGFEYIGFQLNGLLSLVDVPDATQLADYTRHVYADCPYTDSQLSRSEAANRSVIPSHVGNGCPIKHVLYIIKENRTYDQVLGDMQKGNGDPNLCFFGRDVTPNHHALAEQFVLLDNIYCNGEVSQDGHPWSDSAICTDFTQRAWVLSYSGKGQPPGGDSVDDPRSGYLWEACMKKGLTFRDYGEMHSHKSVAGHTNDQFIGKIGPNQPAPGRDPDRADIFLADLHRFEKEGKVPNLMVMSLGEDHTRGTQVGAHTPQAMVASNDQAIGKIVDGISHSSLWKEFAIFIIEDDAQNGADHVDSHRTVGLVISPYTKHHAVDSTMYTTVSMLRTMELILGLAPLTQYDAAATPMFNSFAEHADLTPYSLVGPRIDLNAKNGRTAYGAAESNKMDWSGYDRVDEQALNRILWHAIKGVNVPEPPPVRGAFAATGTFARNRDADDR